MTVADFAETVLSDLTGLRIAPTNFATGLALALALNAGAFAGCAALGLLGATTLSVLAVFGADRDRNTGVEQFVRQNVAAYQKAAQGPATHGQHNVVDGAVGRVGYDFDALQRELLRGKAALLTILPNASASCGAVLA